MLTWINEKAKWVIVIFAAGIAIGLLAMDRVPNQGHSYPIGIAIRLVSSMTPRSRTLTSILA